MEFTYHLGFKFLYPQYQLIDMTAPCYLCGEPAVIDGLCAACYHREHPLLSLPTRLVMTVCKRCGAVKLPGGWKQLPNDVLEPDDVREAQLQLVLNRVLEKQQRGRTITFRSELARDRTIQLIVEAMGSPNELLPPISEHHEVTVRVNYAMCASCSSLSGGYYEAILQIRAENRAVSQQEEAAITAIVNHMTIQDHQQDEHAFVSGASRDKYGLDFWIGSEHLCRHIADEIQSEFCASRKENYKLVSQEKGGKGKYRITIVLRLPQYTIGDFITVVGRPCQVDAIGRGGLTCYDLQSRSQFTINQKSAKWRTIKFVAPESAKRSFIILSRVYQGPVQLMDASSFEMIEMDAAIVDASYQAGDTIDVVFFDGFGPLPVSRVKVSEESVH